MKKILSILLFITACDTTATGHNYLGCDWNIPVDYLQMDDNEYRKQSVKTGFTESFSSVLFSISAPNALQNYAAMDRLSDTEVLVISYPSDEKLSYKSIYINRKTRFGDLVKSDTFQVSQNNLTVSMISVPEKEGLLISNNCMNSNLLQQHHAIKEQLSTEGLRQFLETSPDITILIPE